MATVPITAPGGASSKTRDTSPGGISDAGLQALDAAHLGGTPAADTYTFNKPVYIYANATCTLEVLPAGNPVGQTETLTLQAGGMSPYPVSRIVTPGAADYQVIW